MTARRRNDGSTTDQLRIRVLPSIADISASDWDACANPRRARRRTAHSQAKSIEIGTSAQASCQHLARGSDAAATTAYNPFISHAFSVRARGLGFGHRKNRLDGATPDGRARGRHRRRGAVLSQIPFARRVRLRSWLGRSLRTRWRQLLSEAASLGPLYTRQRTAPAGSLRRTRRRDPGRVGARTGGALPAAAGASSVHVTFMPEAEWTLAAKRGYLQRTDQQFHWAERGLCKLRGIPGGACGPQAQVHPARAAGRRGQWN